MGVTDYRLDPLLYKACHLDIDKFCSAEKNKQRPGVELGGLVINCLKHQFAKKKTVRSLTLSFKKHLKFKVDNFFSIIVIKEWLMLLLCCFIFQFYQICMSICKKYETFLFSVPKQEL